MSTTLPTAASRPPADATMAGPHRGRLPKRLAVALLGLTLTACGGGGGGGSSASSTAAAAADVVVSWNASPQSAVNTNGGGYLVYYSRNSGFAPGDPGVQSLNLPYTSGSQAPTSTTLNLAAGIWYLRVQAYSALNAPSGTGGSYSTPSTQTSVFVP